MLGKKADWLWQGHFSLGDSRGLPGRLTGLRVHVWEQLHCGPVVLFLAEGLRFKLPHCFKSNTPYLTFRACC